MEPNNFTGSIAFPEQRGKPTETETEDKKTDRAEADNGNSSVSQDHAAVTKPFIQTLERRNTHDNENSKC